MGGLSILLATLAMVWNIIYNALFDRLWPVSRVVRNLRVRALHAIGFESGFILIGVTMVALVLGVSLMQAFMLEIGFMLFFLPHTMAFNWAWDTLRERVMKVRLQRIAARRSSCGSPDRLTGAPPLQFISQKLSPQPIHKCDKLHSFLFVFWLIKSHNV